MLLILKHKIFKQPTMTASTIRSPRDIVNLSKSQENLMLKASVNDLREYTERKNEGLTS